MLGLVRREGQGLRDVSHGKGGLSNEWKKAAYPEDYCLWLDPLRLWDYEERIRIKVLVEKVFAIMIRREERWSCRADMER